MKIGRKIENNALIVAKNHMREASVGGGTVSSVLTPRLASNKSWQGTAHQKRRITQLMSRIRRSRIP